MSGKTPWRRLWDALEVAKTRLWDEEAKAYEKFLKAQRMALEEYGRAVDPDGFDKYGLTIEEEEADEEEVAVDEDDELVEEDEEEEG